MISVLNQNGKFNYNEIPHREEVLRELARVQPLGDEQTIIVFDTNAGQMLSSLSVVGGEGPAETRSLTNANDFIVTLNGTYPDAFDISSGNLAYGDQTTVVPASPAFTTGGVSVFVNVLFYYNFNAEVYVAAYEASVNFPSQAGHSDPPDAYYAERFPLAYVTYGGGVITAIDQLNSKELRARRLN